MKKIIYALYIGALLGASSCADLDINPASSIDKTCFTIRRRMLKVR